MIMQTEEGQVTDPVDKNASGIYQRMQEITLENCPFLKTLTHDQMTEFNEIHGTSFDLPEKTEFWKPRKGFGHGPKVLNLKDRMYEVNAENCPFLDTLTED